MRLSEMEDRHEELQLSQLEEFLVSSNKQRGKKFKITGTGGPRKAIKFVKQGMKRHEKDKADR